MANLRENRKLNYNFQAPNFRFQVSSTKFQVPGFKYQVKKIPSGDGCPQDGVGFLYEFVAIFWEGEISRKEKHHKLLEREEKHRKGFSQLTKVF